MGESKTYPNANMFGGGSKCPRCKKTVFFAERATGPGGDWHKSCLVCIDCNKRLDSTNLAERDGEAYCKACYGKRFGPKGFGFAAGAGGLMCGDSAATAKRPVVNQASTQAQGSNVPVNDAPVGGAKFCSQCGSAASGGKFCSQCGNSL